MNESKQRRTTLVLMDLRDEDGTMWRAVSLTEDGGLAILGHDLGRGVERILGCGEYEFERRLSAVEVSTLRQLLAVIGDRFQSTRDLENFAEEHGLRGEYWHRLGD